MKDTKLPAKNLLLTERGEKWLQNFTDEDKQLARELVSSLTLVSEIEFERELTYLLEARAADYKGCIALFGVRELEPDEPIFNLDGSGVNSTPRGVDIGSEGRIATIIRNLARGSNQRFLNHPSISEMRQHRCSGIFFVDDFIGSGKRVKDYIHSFYGNSTIKSWFSYKKFRTEAHAYSGTNEGIKNIKCAKKTQPSVQIVRSCPTISSVLWDDEKKEKIRSLCKRYAKKNKMGLPLGFGKVGALLIFEHSCPNNCPQIFWGSPKGKSWEPLFLGKSIATEARKVFPPEIVRRDALSVLIAAGAHRISKAARQSVQRPLPAEWLAVLSLFDRGIRRTDAVEGVTGMNRSDAAKLIEKCVTTGLLTQKWRLSEFGSQELRATQKIVADKKKMLPNLVDDDYYPLALRRYEER